MKLKKISYKVLGQNDFPKVLTLCSYIKSIFLNFDIILLQEHKLYGSRIQDLNNLFYFNIDYYIL